LNARTEAEIDAALATFVQSVPVRCSSRPGPFQRNGGDLTLNGTIGGLCITSHPILRHHMYLSCT